jgi:hypothetical protein
MTEISGVASGSAIGGGAWPPLNKKAAQTAPLLKRNPKNET